MLNTGLFSPVGIFVNTMNGKISAATGLGTTRNFGTSYWYLYVEDNNQGHLVKSAFKIEATLWVT